MSDSKGDVDDPPVAKEPEIILDKGPEDEVNMEADPAKNDEVVPVEAPDENESSQKPVSGVSFHLNQVMFVDHHTLEAPSNTVHFDEGDVRVYGQKSSQFILEEKGGIITAKIAKDGSVGLSFLRFLYTLVALLMTGFLLIFCLQLLLFLFLSLTTEAGLTSATTFNFAKFFGALLSVPVFVYSLACALAIATAFVIDTWNGHAFINKLSQWKDVSTQWFSFWIFLGIPFLTMVFALLGQSDSWWSIFLLTWFSAVFAYYCLFAATVVIFEVAGCLEMVRRHPKVDCGSGKLWEVMRAGVLCTIKLRLAGKERRQYLVRGSHDPTQRNTGNHLMERTRVGLYTRFTKWPWLERRGVYETIDPPERLATIEEVQDTNPYVTSNTWSLEKLYCRSSTSRFVAVVNGKAKITATQVKSSFYCAMLGSLLVILLLIALLVWLEAGAGAIAFCTVVVGLLLLPAILRSLALFDLWKKTKFASEENEIQEDEVLYQVWETVRVRRASNQLCWSVLALELILFYILPLITLFSVNNYPIGVLFLIVGFVSIVRYYLNAALILSELGKLDVLNEDYDAATSRRYSTLVEEDYREKARLNMIVSRISQGRHRNVWIWTFTIIVGVFCLLFLAAFETGTSGGENDLPGTVSGEEFIYIQENRLPYPTCRMGNGLEIPGSPETALADYAYLSATAYRDPNVTQIWLDQWFGPGFANDTQYVVDNFRQNIWTGVNSSVSYKLITFPSVSDTFAVVSIRGTANAWDALSDAQLWSAAALAQYVRAVLPIGELWTPILENLVYAISLIESDSLERVSFYKQTTAFVRYLKAETQWTEVRVTGHSLGGGLAMITGAQTDTPAIGVSGPNNKISRKTFTPQLDLNELDTFNFNIVPDRDPVPRIDDLARLYQRIDCTAATNRFVDCHTITRSVCEIINTCGTNNGTRPVICSCVETFGYPVPTSVNGLDFKQVCAQVPGN